MKASSSLFDSHKAIKRIKTSPWIQGPLDNVLRRIDRHQRKQARLAPLGSWTEPRTL